jgi:hypothetical protein
MQLFFHLRSRLVRAMADIAIGVLFALAGFFIYLTQLEEYHFTRLVHSALSLPLGERNTVPHTEQNTLLIMRKVNAVMNGRYGQIADVGHPEPGLFWSSDEHLIEPSGACASYTQVLAKALETIDYPIRKVGLSKGTQRGIHHVLETYVEGRWVLMDCMSNLAFRRADGHLASAAEVHANWEYYRSQTPPDYNPDYDYSTYYYTNWQKLPVLGAIVEGIPPLHRWMEAHGVSVWFLLLDVNQWFAGFSFTGAVLLMGARLWPKIRRWRARRSGRDVPERPRPSGRSLTNATAV